MKGKVIEGIIGEVEKEGYRVVKVINEADRVSFILEDSLTRREVEALCDTLYWKGIPAKPFGIPAGYKRGFHIKKPLL